MSIPDVSCVGCWRAACLRPVSPLYFSASRSRSPRRAVRSVSPVILISFDGWRWDYDQKAAAPNLQKLIARGVRAERLIPSFPSKTFPNHYSVVTGLYPAHHGIVANNIFDPESGLKFGLSDREAVGDVALVGRRADLGDRAASGRTRRHAVLARIGSADRRHPAGTSGRSMTGR